jgi:exosortase/archaeosortase family protein
VFLAGVLSYPGYDLGYRFRGAALGIALLVLVNTMRIVLLGLVGANFERSVFDFVHVYVFQTAFVAVVCLTWLVWMKSEFLARSNLGSSGIGIVGVVGCIIFLFLTMESYVKVLAYVSAKLNAFINPNLTVQAFNDEIAFGYAGKLTGFRVYQHIFDSAIFIGLMLVSAKAFRVSVLFKKLMAGASILLALHVAIVLIAGNLLAASIAGDARDSLDWAIRSMSIVAPVLLWLRLRKQTKNEVSIREELDEAFVTN